MSAENKSMETLRATVIEAINPLELKIESLRGEVQALKTLIEGGKKPPKSAKADSAAPANGTSDSKEKPKKEAKVMNSMNYFKHKFANDAEVRKKYWFDSYEAELKVNATYNKGLEKAAAGSVELYKKRANFVWNMKVKTNKTDAEKWKVDAKNAGPVADDTSNLKADE
jgi:hypothetical protein